MNNINHEITTLQCDFEKRKVNVPGLAERFQFYQDLRGYVTDLVECLDEKVGFMTYVGVRVKRHILFFFITEQNTASVMNLTWMMCLIFKHLFYRFQ